MITLLAMSPSGEVYFTRDSHDVIWRHRRLGHRTSVQVSEYTVDWSVSHHGYNRYDETFPTLVGAEAFVISRIPTTAVLAEDLAVNLTIAKSAARVMKRWLHSPTDIQLIVPTVNRLLRNDAVCADADLKASLLALSDSALRTSSHEAVAPPT